ncbi:ATP-grasp fold amidoligase family protein, partial [Providencia stuartii]
MHTIKKSLTNLHEKFSPDWLKLIMIDIRYILEPDEKYRKRIFKQKYGKELDINAPTTFNEKINVRTLKQRNKLFTILSDKIAVRDYVAEKIGEKYLLKNYGYYDNTDQIDFNTLPDKFVLKCNHDSGSVFICTDKKKINKKKLKKHFNFFLKRNLYKVSREWQYKDIQPKIIAEEYIN